MFSNIPNWRQYRILYQSNWFSITLMVLCGFFIATGSAAYAQDGSALPVIVQPGAPGKPSKRLPASATAKLPPRSQAEAEFMQGMADSVPGSALTGRWNSDLKLAALHRGY